MVTLYGISNCDTVKKARNFLDGKGIDYQFHDFRKDGLQSSDVEAWLSALGNDVLINKRSRTWKELSPKQQESISGQGAAKTVATYPTLIKRPLLKIESGEAKPQYFVGFNQDQYVTLFT